MRPASMTDNYGTIPDYFWLHEAINWIWFSCSDQGTNNLKVEDVSIIPLSRTDLYLVGFKHKETHGTKRVIVGPAVRD